MDHETIETKAKDIKDAWNNYIKCLPLVDDPRWDYAIMLHTTFECLGVIAEQLRKGNAREIRYRVLRTMFLGGKISPVKPSPRKGHCYTCYMPMDRGEGTIYDIDNDHVYLCVLCDPQYEHCEICNYPVVGKCLGKCSNHLK